MKEIRKMREVSKWYVLTGGPSSGITSTIKYLEKLGYYVIDEAARKIVDEEIAKGKTIDEIRIGKREFQRRVFKRELKILKSAPKDRIVFFDKGIPDCLAYYEIHGLALKEVLQQCQEKIYTKAFFLKRLPYKKDYARVEDEETAKRIGELSKKWYVSLGYEVVLIPRASVEERTNMILSHVV